MSEPENNNEEYSYQEPNKSKVKEEVADQSELTGRPKSDAKIEVYNFVLKDEKFGKYAAYSVRGVDKEGEFNITRRYSEFDKIRSILVLRWPGVHIPSLPPKKTMHNLETKFIEERRRALDLFCKRVTECSFLHYSEEFQLFLRSNAGDLEKTFQAFQKLDYEEVLARYVKSFAYLSEKDITNETSLKIGGFRLFLTKIRGNFETYKKISKSVATAQKLYYEQLATLHHTTCVPYEKNVFSEYHSNKDAKNIFYNQGNLALTDAAEKLKEVPNRDSLVHFSEWIDLEAREIDAFMETINQRDKFDSLRNKNQDKQKSESEDLQKVIAGKATLKTLFSKKPKEEKISDIEKNLAASSKTAETLNSIFDIITLLLAYEEIDKFKKTTLDGYYKTLNISSNNELTNLNTLSEYWTSVIQNENISGLEEQL